MTGTARRPRNAAAATAIAETAALERQAEEAAVDAIGDAAVRLRDTAREAVGVTGVRDVGSLRSTLDSAGVGLYPATALGLLVAVDQLQTAALTILGPEITGTLGISRSGYAFVILLKTLVVTLAALPIAALVQRRPWRAGVCVGTALAWTVLTAATAYVISLWGLLLIAVAAGAATASVRSLHQPLLLDSYPPQARVRVLSFYRAFDNAGDIIGPLVIALCTVLFAFTWRGVFIGLAVVAFVATMAASRLRDPGFGVWDTAQVRAAVRTDAGAGTTADELDADLVELGFFEVVRRLLLITTIRRILVAYAVLGMFLAPFLVYLAFFLQERWQLGPGARSAFFAVMPVFGIIGLRLFGRRGEEMFRQDPAQLLRLAGLLVAMGVSSLAVAVFVPFFPLTVLFFGLALGTITVVTPAIALPMFSIVPAHMRVHLGALTGVFLTGVGGTAGLLLLSGVEQRFGTIGAILSLALPGIISGLVLRNAAKTVNSDLDQMLGQLIEEEEVRTLVNSGIRLPMLACRGVNFSYGQLQVLFDVDFTVDDGEIVALLGTNGAGKSTLLRVISGLGLPTTGSVRYRGVDISYLDAERRVGLGISQVPGGRAVFGPMSVVENLRVTGHSHGRNRRAIETGIEASFEAFPRLAERRNQLASTLSGGEQQMLALSTALILQPRLLLIDELSLGLAPKIVGELLDMVRRINESGTAVVLVEQSVNIALSVVEHAYFMEKGAVRFDGPSADLLARPDLLRSVFLEGASEAFGGRP